MKKILMSIAILIFAMCTTIAQTRYIPEPLVVVVLMVKDEAPVLEKTLLPYVEGNIGHFILYDTGSTDGTQEVARQFFAQHGIQHGYIIEEPFVNFATSRNRALEHTERIFPDATFMLMPDAEWYMHNVKQLVQFCVTHKYHTDNSYFVHIKSTHLAFLTPRLIRCHKEVRFVGAVHEILNNSSQITVPEECYFEWRPSAKGQSKSAERWKRDRDVLLKEYEKNPFDARTTFYLAQTYDCLGDYENAYIYYQKRAQMMGPNEDHYLTLFRLGTVAQQMGTLNMGTIGKEHKESPLTPPLVRYYLEAFNTRPQRAEPLVKIAQYYLSKNMMDMAFLYANRACDIPYPTQDRLPVERPLYDFTRYDVLGICAWYVGEFEIGEWAVKKAMESNPNPSHLHYNLKLYTERKQRPMAAAAA